MWAIVARLSLGSVLLIAGIAARIVASSHPPHRLSNGLDFSASVGAPWGFSQTAYDLVRIGSWALLIVGSLVVLTALIAYWRAGP